MSNEDDEQIDMARMAVSINESCQDSEEDAEPSGSRRKRTTLPPKHESHPSTMSKTSCSFKSLELEKLGSLEPVEHIDDLPTELFGKILSYLRIWEQSPCRLVSHNWNNQILNLSQYAHQSYILLNYERVTRGECVAEILDEFDPVFQSIRMIRVPPQRIGVSLSPSFAGNVRHMDLFHCGPFTWSTFLDILISCYHLEELRVRKCPFKWPYDAEEWRNKYIEWQGKIAKCENHFPDFKAVEFRVKDPHDALYMWKLVSEYSTRLQRISFSCKSPPEGLKLDSGVEELDDMYETILELFDVLVETVNKFSKNMELFHSYLIDPPQHKSNNGSKSMANLNREEETIINQFCSKVLARLEWERLNLKSFCLYGGEISGENIPMQTDILGNFIKSQVNLEKVILPRMRFHTHRQFEDILLNIPKTVRCIRVPTFDRMPNCLSTEFHQLGEYYVETHGSPDLQTIIPHGTILPNVKTFSFYNCSEWLWQTVKIMTIVHSFPCVTQLLIRHDGPHQCAHIGDSDVQNICRYLPNLKKLHMTNVDCVSDFGFTGFVEKECKLMNETGTYVANPGSKIGYSFSQLKHIEYLFLSGIGFRVTNVSMIHGFVFQNLRFMTLVGYPKVTPWGVECLRRRNFNLKKWSVDFHDPSISQVVEQLRSISISRPTEMDAYDMEEPRKCTT